MYWFLNVFCVYTFDCLNVCACRGKRHWIEDHTLRCICQCENSLSQFFLMSNYRPTLAIFTQPQGFVCYHSLMTFYNSTYQKYLYFKVIVVAECTLYPCTVLTHKVFSVFYTSKHFLSDLFSAVTFMFKWCTVTCSVIKHSKTVGICVWDMWLRAHSCCCCCCCWSKRVADSFKVCMPASVERPEYRLRLKASVK